eukprot:6577500-Prymnesium_polylepis.1
MSMTRNGTTSCAISKSVCTSAAYVSSARKKYRSRNAKVTPTTACSDTTADGKLHALFGCVLPPVLAFMSNPLLKGSLSNTLLIKQPGEVHAKGSVSRNMKAVLTRSCEIIRTMSERFHLSRMYDENPLACICLPSIRRSHKQDFVDINHDRRVHQCTCLEHVSWLLTVTQLSDLKVLLSSRPII